MDALKDGQSWLDSNPEADAEEIKEKHKERWRVDGWVQKVVLEVGVAWDVVVYFNGKVGTVVLGMGFGFGVWSCFGLSISRCLFVFWGMRSTSFAV